MRFFLYLFLAGQCPIEVPGHYPTLEECQQAGQVEVARWFIVHHNSPAFAWCVRGGESDRS